MKTIKLIIIAAVIFISGAVNAQVQVNIGAPPLWGPSGYNSARYYYLPDVESYYDVQSSMFIYNSNGFWVHRAFLPWQYRNYDLYGGYKVVMPDCRGNQPYLFHKACKMKYPKGYNQHHSQKTFGEKPGKGNSYGKNQNNEHSNKNYSQGNSNKKENQGYSGKNYQQGNGNKNNNKGNFNKNSNQGNSNNKMNKGNNNNSQKNHGKSNGKGKRD